MDGAVWLKHVTDAWIGFGTRTGTEFSRVRADELVHALTSGGDIVADHSGGVRVVGCRCECFGRVWKADRRRLRFNRLTIGCYKCSRG